MPLVELLGITAPVESMYKIYNEIDIHSQFGSQRKNAPRAENAIYPPYRVFLVAVDCLGVLEIRGTMEGLDPQGKLELEDLQAPEAVQVPPAPPEPLERRERLDAREQTELAVLTVLTVPPAEMEFQARQELL